METGEETSWGVQGLSEDVKKEVTKMDNLNRSIRKGNLYSILIAYACAMTALTLVVQFGVAQDTSLGKLLEGIDHWLLVVGSVAMVTAIVRGFGARSEVLEGEIASGRERFKSFLGILPGAACLLDSEATPLEYNALYERHFRSQPQSKCNEDVALAAKSVFSTGRPFDCLSETPDDRTWLLQAFAIPGDREGQTLCALICIDVTDHRRRKDELRAAYQSLRTQERFRVLGQLVAGVAHDINNALSPIVGYSSALLIDRTLTTDQRDSVEEIARAGDHIVGLVERMRAFYRQRRTGHREASVAVREVATDAIALTKPRWTKATVDIRASLTDDLVVEMDKTELTEVLVNLIVNAIDAMESSTEKTLTLTYGTDFDGTRWISVTDTGAGMDTNTKASCMEPLFTTKGESGTGMGLATVRSIVEDAGGRVELRSHLGEGTEVRLRLPAPLTWTPQQCAIGQRILVIDDEEVVATMLRTGLTGPGRVVVDFTTAVPAMEMFRQVLGTSDSFDAVIVDWNLGLDVTDPYAFGDHVLREVKELSPETPVLLMSASHLQDTVTARFDAFVSKPLSLASLRRTLEQLMTATR
jgi:signal transduction histidine kinase